MGPIALFDKSFLQSLSLDESVWFAHFFMPVVCPLFYVETLADLEKAVRAGRTPEQEVGIIARKFPEVSGAPTIYHGTLAIGELLGQPVPMDGRPLLAGGRVVVRDGKRGVVYDETPEAEAFSRWQIGRFLDVERGMAKQWREGLQRIDLKTIANTLRDIGIDNTTCRTLEDARAMARTAVSGRDKPFARIALVMSILDVPHQHQTDIVKRWAILGYPPLIQHAPYTAHVLSVELFFQFALAAHLIGTERASNRVDIAYLNYLPFCMMFVSTDDLHRRCAPHFLRPDQQFVWGPALKEDLRRINEHFIALPDSVKEQGIMAFAQVPPKRDGSLVRELRAQFLTPGYDEQLPVRVPEGEQGGELVQHLNAWSSAPTASMDVSDGDNDELEMMALERKVHRKKVSWYQVPKGLPEDDG